MLENEKGSGQIAVVAGIGRGLGAAFYHAHCNAGYDVAGIAGSIEFSAALEQEPNAGDTIFQAKECDVTDNNDVEHTLNRMIAYVKPERLAAGGA